MNIELKVHFATVMEEPKNQIQNWRGCAQGSTFATTVIEQGDVNPSPTAESELQSAAEVEKRDTLPKRTGKANFREDISSILLLFFLYILQGIPIGIIQTIPFLLQAKKVPYTEQARFSIAAWPYGLKILYAPIVDAVYVKRFGRRKSWLIPLQYLIAGFLLLLTFYIEQLLDTAQVKTITVVFFILNFLAASQDITVDGWALTMLKPKNVSYAATCNAVGQTLGIVMGYSGFLVLNSASFVNNFRTVPQDSGLVTFPQFLFFWAIIFAVTTTGVLFFKREDKECAQVTEQHMDILASYKNLWQILKLRNMHYFIAFLLTARIGISTTEEMTKLKLVENGVPKEWIAFFSIPLIPVKLLVPLVMSKFTVGSNAMGVYINALPFNILFGLIFPAVVLWTSSFKGEELPSWYFIFLFFVFAMQLIPVYTMFLSLMAFAAKVSDPAIGGTYMTLINTLSSVGKKWTHALALYLVDFVAVYVNTCDGIVHDLFKNQISRNYTILATNVTGSLQLEHKTLTHGHVNLTTTMSANGEGTNCVVKIDGYYMESIVCVAIGFLWLIWGRPTILSLQKRPLSSWRIFK